jgi:HAD superfamily hydrolase (TIGR01509 family)
MKATAVIFDMDGLLIDSEPLWKEAGDELLQSYNLELEPSQYEITMGLRTNEFLAYWFQHYHIPLSEIPIAEKTITNKVLDKITQTGTLMPGALQTLQLFQRRGIPIGLASSSSMDIIEHALSHFQIKSFFHHLSSAGTLQNGKPHPEVYLNCAEAIQTEPTKCVCFEDSFNGMIAAKAARMKCIVVPAPYQAQQPRWGAADLKISSLLNLNELLLDQFFA